MKEQFKREFLPKEILLKLASDFGAEQFEQKINLIKDYTLTIKSSFDSRVFKTRYNNEIGFVYWQAEQYESAIKFFRRAIKNKLVNVFVPIIDTTLLVVKSLERFKRCSMLSPKKETTDYSKSKDGK
ncbi:tetratricopeptide repeat protein [Echinicola shivajiensis]|uniref:tetratricopeptide repeat protein n=1 Tax=Echinicola shivajiensis TaxID=1035916 RepID=UPI001BFCA4C7|nr:tetratricopeptide repeat protein [Echinicola shivajiensis]